MNAIKEKIVHILRCTKDGDDLDPSDLRLIEVVVNATECSKALEVALSSLHKQVLSGYQKPWLFGLNHLTQDHEGYVYYKGHQVEHYSPGVQVSAAVELVRRCEHIESLGLPLSSGTVIWRWERLRYCTPGHPYLSLLTRDYEFIYNPQGKLAVSLYQDNQCVCYERSASGEWRITHRFESAYDAYHGLRRLGYKTIEFNQSDADAVDASSTDEQASFERIVALLEKEQFPANFIPCIES